MEPLFVNDCTCFDNASLRLLNDFNGCAWQIDVEGDDRVVSSYLKFVKTSMMASLRDKFLLNPSQLSKDGQTIFSFTSGVTLVFFYITSSPSLHDVKGN